MCTNNNCRSDNQKRHSQHARSLGVFCLCCSSVPCSSLVLAKRLYSHVNGHLSVLCINKWGDKASKNKRDFNALTKVITSSLVEYNSTSTHTHTHTTHNAAQKSAAINNQSEERKKNQTCNKRTRTYVHCR